MMKKGNFIKLEVFYMIPQKKGSDHDMDFSDEKKWWKIWTQTWFEWRIYFHTSTWWLLIQTKITLFPELSLVFWLFEKLQEKNIKRIHRRSSNLKLEFQKEHPQFYSHHLNIRSLHLTPILTGKPRPSYYSFKNKITRKIFIFYYEILLISWRYRYDDAQIPSELKKYVPAIEYILRNKLSELMYLWSGADGYVSALLRDRFFTSYNILNNIDAPYKWHVASIKWQNRDADKWSDISTE